jgi:hypothetical protein
MNFPDENDWPATELAKNLEQYVAEVAQLHRAIGVAQEHQLVEEEAIANECAAQFYLAWGKEKLAAVYLQDAYDCYSRAGCNIATENLGRDYPQLLPPSPRQSPPPAGNSYFNDEFIVTNSVRPSMAFWACQRPYSKKSSVR